MRKYLTIIALLLAINVYAHKDKPYQFYWHADSIDVFGTRKSEFTYSEKDMFYYRLSNDSNYIYADVRIFDDEIKQQILRSGLTIWIDPAGRKDKKTGVRYPVRFMNRGMISMADSTGGRRPDNMKGRYPMNTHGTLTSTEDNQGNGKTSIMLIGFEDSGPVMIPDSSGNSFRGTITFQKGTNMLDYEVVLPLAKLPVALTLASGKKGQAMIGFSYDSAPGGMGKQYGGHGGGSHGGGHGMYGGGGTHGGGGMHGGGRMQGGGGSHHGGGPGGAGYQSGGGGETVKSFWIKNIRLALLPKTSG